MILRDATILYKGIDPDSLSKGSHKRVCCACDRCGRIRWIPFQSYHSLCLSCSRSGKGNSMYDVHRFGKIGPNYQGGKITKICEVCKKDFKVILSRKNTSKFCCKKCEGKWKSENLRGKNCYNWKGGFNKKRPWVLPELQCIQLNKRFLNSEFHHITKSIGVFIPKELHKHLYHNLKNSQGINNMNLLALQFIKGEM